MMPHSVLPSLSQLDFLSSNPVQCYCNKPAHRNYTLEYGTILECASYGTIKENNYQVRYACGFHVHELSWVKLKQQVQSRSYISSHYFELRACPLYNFTYQTVFNLENSFSKMTPFALPNCFCQNEVKLCDGLPLYFSCQNRDKEGARRCDWYLKAKNVAFIKNEHSLHSYVSLERYENNYRIKKSVFERKWLELEDELKVSSFRTRQVASQLVEKREELLSTIKRLARVRAELKMREREK